MNFTDIFIRKPVLATTISLLILVLGVRSLTSLTVRQYPKTQNAVVTVNTAYYGADAQTVAGFITQPLEGAIAQAQGIDYMSSTSASGASIITATLRLNYDANRALTEINTQVNSVRNQLPPEAQQPVLTVQVGETIDSMYMGFFSDVLPNNNVTDYLVRVVKPKLDSVEGVQTAEILGARQFALRAWLDPKRMGAYGVSASDVRAALASNNYLAALGTTKGQMVSVDMTAATSLHSVDEFKKLVVKQKDGAIVRLEDVANVVLGAENYDFSTAFGGRNAVFIPNGITGEIVYDATQFIRSSIDEVEKTLIQALVIVSVVIFLFLGSVRAVAIPLIAMPLSLIGAFFVMLLLGYSINLLTLLALVLAIGLVVDDAIIVVENVDRHMKEEGKPPLEASLMAARELGGPIIAMTIVLVAVYIPIGFQGGLTGALFTEFAFTLAGAVAVSGIVALTLSPMMTSRIFRSEQESGRFVRFIDRQFGRLHHGYQRVLHGTLDTWIVIVVMGVILLAGTVYLFMTSKSELAPAEDQGVVLYQAIGPPNATPQQMSEYSKQIFDIARSFPEYDQIFQITGTPTTNQGFGGVLFKPWSERKRGANELQQELQQKWSSIAGATVAAFQFPPLPGSRGLPLQIVIKTTEPFERLNEVSQAVLAKARASGMFFFVDTDLKLDKPQTTVTVDRDMAATLGMTQQDVGAALSAALSGGYVNYFSIAGRSYKVIPQVLQADRLNPHQILDYYLRTPDGSLIPASTLARQKTETVPEGINHFQQLNSATIMGVFAPSLSEKQVLDFMRQAIAQTAPTGYQVDYAGTSRQFVQESGGFVITLLFAIIIVFLTLSAQYESFRDPIVILVSVPMALFGALIFINLGVTTLNIYTQVGLVTLMGLVSKHGILIVQFANDLQRAGKSKREAIEEAAAVRLRPILMTTAAMVLGVIPLVIAAGAGAAGRHAMGIVIFTGLSIGTLFTLFVVPAVYMLLAQDHRATAAARAGSAAVSSGLAPTSAD
ncbi:MAG: multidrug efflux protein [Betaproteobacteria bacterium]|nr:MAG: multidrug efflux protein [Betaproteobacteria bacterium]